jgi:uncharacterized protein (DUF2062 family)
MFKRRKPLSLRHQFRETVWPSMGYKRAFYYWEHRIFRTGDSTYRVTAGLACGAAVSFSPFLGTHVMQAFLLAWLVRGNLLAAFMGTIVGLPPFLPFIFWLSYRVGLRIFELLGIGDLFALPAHFHMHDIMHAPIALLGPLTVGGYTCAAVVWVAVYFAFYGPVGMARKAYRLHRMRKYNKEHRA